MVNLFNYSYSIMVMEEMGRDGWERRNEGGGKRGEKSRGKRGKVIESGEGEGNGSGRLKKSRGRGRKETKVL